MPFDPSKPADHSPLASAEMRGQLTALNTDIQQRVSQTDLAVAITNAIAGTSNNSNGVFPLNQVAEPNYGQSQMQAVLSKLDELINALRR